MKTAVILGAAGFLGHHLVRRLLAEGYSVRGVDIATYPYDDEIQFCMLDLRSWDGVRLAFQGLMDFDEAYQLAADMGGMGWIGGDHDAEIMLNSSLINLNVVRCLRERDFKGKVFFSSSACVYGGMHINCRESDAYPAQPDSEYGWEKLYAERLYLASSLDVRIARFHNVFGPECTWRGGREKFPAALCRKIAEAEDGGTIELWGDGTQRRSFLYVDEAIEGVRRLMYLPVRQPVNIGSDRIVSIRAMQEMVCHIAGKWPVAKSVPGPIGVHARNSHNALCRELLGWAPTGELEEGLRKTYEWIAGEIDKAKRAV